MNLPGWCRFCLRATDARTLTTCELCFFYTEGLRGPCRDYYWLLVGRSAFGRGLL